MNRRRFLQLGAAGSILGIPQQDARGDAPATAQKRGRSAVPDLVTRALTQPNGLSLPWCRCLRECLCPAVLPYN
jgi:hypothetical protein